MGERTDRMNDRTVKDSRARRSTADLFSSSGTLSSDPDVIAESIEQTRSEMSETIGALQDRLDPERLADQAVETATEVTEQARDAVKDAAKYAIDEAKAAIRELVDDGTFKRLTDQAVTAAGQITDQAKDAAKETTTHAIGEAKSAVRELTDQAKDAVRASTVGRVEQVAGITRDSAQEMGLDMMTLIRQNPLPAALAAAGIGWLWMQRSSGETTYAGQSNSYRSPSQQGNGYGETASHLVGEASQRLGSVVDQAKEMTGQVAGQAKEKTGQVAGQAQSGAGQLQSTAKSAVKGISADPLAVAAVGVVLGAVAAIMLPSTEKEQQLMGDARERMVNRVQEMGGETVEKVQHVAAEVGKTVAREVEAQGLTQAPEGVSASS